MRIERMLRIPCLLAPSHKLAIGYCLKTLLPGSTVVEIGSASGGSARLMHDCATRSEIHTVDVYDAIDRAMVDGCSRLHITFGGAERFIERYPHTEIDFLFIDADHSFFGVKNDFQLLRPFLKKGATVAFHDYGAGYLGVRLFCDALLESRILDHACDVDGLLIAEYTGQGTWPSEAVYAQVIDRLGQLPVHRPERCAAHLDDETARLAIDSLETWSIIGKGADGRYFARFFSLPQDCLIDSSDAVLQGKYIVCSHYQDEIATYLKGVIGVGTENIIPADAILSYAMFLDLTENSGAQVASASNDADERTVARLFSHLDRSFLHALHANGLLVPLFKRVHFD